jgi:outer membrane immunogenic protein
MKRVAALLVFVFAVACPAHADWKGPYVGAGVGAFWGVSNWTPYESFAPFPATPLRMDFDGVLFSGKFGYRTQAGNFVFGVEGEYSKGHVDGSAPCIGDATALTCETELRSQVKVTGQMGYSLGDWLPYLSAGYVQASVRATALDASSVPQLIGKGTHNGVLVGGGLDYRISRWVSIGVEYQHIWYGSDIYGMSPVGLADVGPFKTKIALDPDYVGINVKVRGDGN